MTTDTQSAPTDAEIEALAVEHEAFGFGRVDARGLTTHGFDPDGLGNFSRAVLAKWGTPAPVGVEPIGYLYCGGSYGDELEDWEFVADQHQCDKLNEYYGALGKEVKLPTYITSQPTQALAMGRVPQVDAAAKALAECMYYPWEHMSEAGRQAMREHAQAVLGAAHGIKSKETE